MDASDPGDESEADLCGFDSEVWNDLSNLPTNLPFKRDKCEQCKYDL